MKDVEKFRDKAINENKTIYFEKEVPVSAIPKPDMQNFVKLDAVLEDLNGKSPLEEKLRHIVPPQVRVMQEELRNDLQVVLNQQYETENKVEQE